MTTIGNLLRGLGTLIKRWPVRTQALIVAGIAMGSAFGLGWNGAQVGAVSAFTAAALALLTEQAVTPLSEPTIPSGTSVTVTTTGPEANEQVVV